MSLVEILENSIFSLFPNESVEFNSYENYILDFKAGQKIVSEGEALDVLYIPLTASVYLQSQNNNIGSVQIGRAINLFCFLRSLPAQYSFIVKEDCQILAIPRTEIDALFNLYPQVKAYLTKLTESPDCQTMSKDLRSLGLSNQIVVDFISRFEETEILPQHYLLTKGQPASGAYFLTEGKFLFRDQGAANSSWLVPLKSWIGWGEALENRPSSKTVVTLAKSKYLKISSKNLIEVSLAHEEEFALIHNWIEQGQFREIDPDESKSENTEVDDVVDLFADAKIENRPKWKFKYPWVRQNDEMDCGPACLAIISQFFGKDLSVNFWRSKLSTDRSGTSLYDLALTTEKSGFISHCLEVNDIRDVDSFLFPFIALRRYHYVVVYKLKKNSVVVGDPAFGIKEVPLEDFNVGLEKVGLFLKPNTDFYLLPESVSTWRHYLKLFSGLEKDLSLAMVCAILGVFVSLAPPMISQIALDEVLVQKNTDLLWLLMGVTLAVTLVSSFISWAQNYYFIYIMNKFNFRATSVFIQKMFSLPYNFFATRHVGDFTHRLSEMNKLRSFVTDTLFGVVLNLLTMIIYATVLALINIKVALVVFCLAPFMVILPFLTSNYLSRLYNQVFSKSSDQSGFISDLIKGVSAIKTLGAEFTSRLRFEEKLVDLIRSQNSFSRTALTVQTWTNGYHQAVNFGVMSFAIYLGIKGELSAGKVISLTLITSKIFEPLLALTRQWGHFIEAKSVLNRLNDIFLTDSESVKETSKSFVTKAAFRGDIEFKDVWFRYGGEASDWVLKGVSFKIEAGQKVSIVGPSGSGKSTLAYLITRMYEPTQGQILIDGKDYREYEISWLRKQVGLLVQENFLFPGSLAENIAFNALEMNEEKIRKAAQRASAIDFIEKKPGGFDHYVPPGGVGFSGGEKQRVALARMFYQEPSIVVLDEATSALDGISEEQVLKSLRSELAGSTLLNIAHRYSTVQSSDYALVMCEGKFSGFGTIDYLKENNTIFQKLFKNEQFNVAPALKKVS